MRAQLLFLVASVGLFLAGCEPLEEVLFDEFDEDTCQSGASVPNLTGRWFLRGEGIRQACDDERLEGPFQLSTYGAFLDVEQDVSTNRLRLATPVEGLTFFGQVSGSCVYVEAEESVGEGRIARYVLNGIYVPDNGGVGGTFTGSGPGTCAAEGSFSLLVD